MGCVCVCVKRGYTGCQCVGCKIINTMIGKETIYLKNERKQKDKLRVVERNQSFGTNR
uniref:Uncharacterized protein n=1 Tax=Octopus bimaculoides TaxID=37653 RepID=A0A0L8FWA6_OCTBM